MSESRYRVLIAGLVAVACLALYFGITATDTGDGDGGAATARRDVVEHLIPRPGDEVLRQAELGIDLAPGWEGALSLNGVDIPTEELRLVPQQNQVFFTPGEGKAVERLLAGPNCASVTAWRSSLGRGTAEDQIITWCFDAL